MRSPDLSVSRPARPADRRFVISWQERTIGEHHVSFRQTEGELEARTRVDLTVKLAFITLYDLHHESEERWKGGRLTRLAAHTRENATAVSRLRGAAGHDGFRLEAPDDVLLPAGIFTSDSLWNPAILAQRKLLDTHSGALLDLTTEPRSSGRRTLAGAATDVQEHAFVTPRLRGSLWYDPAGGWVGGRFDLRGETVEYSLAR
jgi:Domain of unknown function (DUF6134)